MIRTLSTSRLLAAALVCVAVVVGAAACGGSDDNSAIEIGDTWARTSATGQTAGAVYMTISAGDEADRLVGASVPADVAGQAQLHETVMADGSDGDMSSDDMTTEEDAMTDSDGTMTDAEGMDDADAGATDTTDHDSMDGAMTMREVAGIDIPAGETVELEPGGYHVMLLDLAGPLEEGSTFDLTLQFENAGDRTVEVTVRNA